ncbi:hypothetical protein [Olleya namhaensis]|uniref:hypothetical protein n=1 Tax=Olleya namhaensis TaxID=1144750 RepID=UPI00249050C0|nr:hypothetical protein [Olleya namhaensis]
MKNVLVALLFCFALLGCKPEEATKKEDTKTIVNEVKKPSKLVILMDYKVDKAQKVQCVFSNIELANNKQNGAFVITETLAPSSDFSKAKFEMFGDYVALKVQLRLGNAPIKLQVNKMVLSYEDKEVIVSGKDINKYFAPNKHVKYDPATQTIETVTVKGKHQPILTLRQGFINRLFSLI